MAYEPHRSVEQVIQSALENWLIAHSLDAQDWQRRIDTARTFRRAGDLAASPGLADALFTFTLEPDVAWHATRDQLEVAESSERDAVAAVIAGLASRGALDPPDEAWWHSAESSARHQPPAGAALPPPEALWRRRFGLAMGGGGAKGAYTAGAVIALQQYGLFAHDLRAVRALHGVSTGGLVASMIAVGQFLEAKRVYTTAVEADVVKASHGLAYEAVGGLRGEGLSTVLALCAMFGPEYIFSTEPLRRTIARIMGAGFERFDQIIAMRDRVTVGFTAVDFESGEIRTFSNADPCTTGRQFCEALLGSTNQPVLMDLPAVHAPGGKGHLHADGGMREVLPVRAMLAAPFGSELDVIVTIALEKSRISPRTSESLRGILPLLLRTIEVLSHNVGYQDIREIEYVDALQRARSFVRRRLGDGAWAEFAAELPGAAHKMLGGTDRTCSFITLVSGAFDPPFAHSLDFRPEVMTPAFVGGMRDARRAVLVWWNAERNEGLDGNV